MTVCPVGEPLGDAKPCMKSHIVSNFEPLLLHPQATNPTYPLVSFSIPLHSAEPFARIIPDHLPAHQLSFDHEDRLLSTSTLSAGMPYEQRRPAMPRSSKRKFDDIINGEQETPTSLQPLALAQLKIKAVLGRLKDKFSYASGHNWSVLCGPAHRSTQLTDNHSPCKDAGTTHAFKPSRCFPQQHAGYCPGCNSVVCWIKGCPMSCTKDLHRCKGEDLLQGPLASWEVYRYHKEHNIVSAKPSWKANTQPEIQGSCSTKSNKKGTQFKKPRFK